MVQAVVLKADFLYSIHDEYITITGYIGSGGAVAIPETIGGLPVRAVASLRIDDATNITSVAIPNGVTTIGNSAFDRCDRLTSITIPASVDRIGVYAFKDCGNLSSIDVVTNNLSYRSEAGVLFNKSQTDLIQCPGGKTGIYQVPARVTGIGSHAFSGCARLSEVRIGSSVESIGDTAFRFCSGLSTIFIPSSVTNIENGAFYRCHGLKAINVDPLNATYGSIDGILVDKGGTSLIQFPPGESGNVTVPDSITDIRRTAFYDCLLAGITIPENVSSIGDYAFAFCSSLGRVSIGSGVSCIRNGAFASCYSLTNVTIGGAVTNIEEYAFADCLDLPSVVIPDSVISIKEAAFLGCNGLSEIFVHASNSAYRSVDGVLFDKEQTTLIQFPSAKTGRYTIPSNVCMIANFAFGNSFGLTTVTIPRNVTSIGGEAFAGCTNLSGAYFDGDPPNVPSRDEYFYSIFDGANVTVYYLKESDGWGASFDGHPTALWLPKVQSGEDGYGVRTNQFGFNLSWVTDRTVVVEACDGLANPVWTPVGTNTLTDGSSYFSDPQWTNSRARFYRLRAQ